MIKKNQFGFIYKGLQISIFCFSCLLNNKNRLLSQHLIFNKKKRVITKSEFRMKQKIKF